MLRSLIGSAALFALFFGFGSIVSGGAGVAHAQGETDRSPVRPKKNPDKSQKNVTAEQVVESAIFVYGTRPLLTQIRRNGLERGRVCKPTCDVPGKTEEASYERRFVRGESSQKDKIRVDQKLPTLEYSLIYGDGRLWGIINGAAFTPRQDAANTFLSQHNHSIDKLLRYKENGSTISLVGREKQKGLDLYVVDVLGEDKQRTRYYVSAKTLYILWLEYEEASAGPVPLKYKRSFHNYRYAQGTLVPFKTVLVEEGSQTQETKVLTVTFGVKLDDALFKNPEA